MSTGVSTGVSTSGGRHAAEHQSAAGGRSVSRGTVRRRDGGDLEALAALGLI
jgi:hypothetical protein